MQMKSMCQVFLFNRGGRINLFGREKDLGEEIKFDENFDINTTQDSGNYIEELFSDVLILDEESMLLKNVLSIIENIAGIIGFGSKT